MMRKKPLLAAKKFHNPTLGQLSLKQVSHEIINYIHQQPKQQYKIIIGTDSESRERVDFVSAVVVQRIGAGGRYFWQRVYRAKMATLRQRIYEEVNLSLALAQKILGELRNQLDPELLTKGFEIHVDAGQNGETREMLKEVIGMVRGNGFNVKTKPEAYCATKVADKHV